MKPLLFLIVSIATSHGRLIERSTENIPKIEIKTTKPNLPIRLTRAAFDEDTLSGFSKEYTGQSDELPQTYNRRTRHFVVSSSKQAHAANIARLPRESSDKLNNSNSENTTIPSVSPMKPRDTLVKKPIPKFSDIDYDDDFQMRIIKSPAKFIDSGEHEDDDFNLEDYDFDINHDEFAGRGKPLEPRTKPKEHMEHHLPEQEPISKSPPVIKIQSKLVIPPDHKSNSNKKERSAKVQRRVNDKKKEDDYNYDETTTAKSKENENKQHDGDDYGDENEESREIERKSVRTARSPWSLSSYMDKLSDKTSTLMSRVLGVLPMFPQLPHYKKLDKGFRLTEKRNPNENIVKFNH